MSNNTPSAYGGNTDEEKTHYFGNANTQYPFYQGGQPNGHSNGNGQYGQGYPPNYPNQGQWPPSYPPYPPQPKSSNMKYVWIGIVAALLGVIAFLIVMLLTNKDSTSPTPKNEPVTVPKKPSPEPESKPEPKPEPTPQPEPVLTDDPEPDILSGNWTFEGRLYNGDGGYDYVEISLDSDIYGNCTGYFENSSYGLWIDLSGTLTANSFKVSGYDTSAGNHWTINCKRGSGYNYSGTIKSSASMRLSLTSNR